MFYYLIEHWEGKQGDPPTSSRTYEIVQEKQLWRILNDAPKLKARLVVYKLGEPIIDWTHVPALASREQGAVDRGMVALEEHPRSHQLTSSGTYPLR